MPERIVRPGILTSDRVEKLSWAGETFYRRLMSIVDDFGRYDGRSLILRAQLYPLRLDRVSEPDIDKWKAECAKAGLVRFYSVQEKEYLEILDFNQRQRAEISKWPDPPDIRRHSHADARLVGVGVGDEGGGGCERATARPPGLASQTGNGNKRGGLFVSEIKDQLDEVEKEMKVIRESAPGSKYRDKQGVLKPEWSKCFDDFIQRRGELKELITGVKKPK